MMNLNYSHITNSYNTIIADAILQEYHYQNKSTSYHGVAKVGANIASTSIGLTDLGANLGFHSINLPLKYDPGTRYIGNKMKDLAADLNSNLNLNKIRDKKDDVKNNSLYNIKEKGSETNSSTTSISSNITAGNDFVSTSAKDTTVKASNIEANNQLTLNAENLNLLTTTETEFTSKEYKTTRTLSFKNYNAGNIGTKDIINTTLTANNLTFNITDKVNAQFSQKDNPTYLSQLTQQIDPDKLKLQPIEFTEQSWNDAVRGLTTTGQIGIAVGAVVIAIVTGGIGSGVSGAMMTAAATTAGTTASISATNTSMNADGSLLKQTKDIGKTTIKDTTSDQSLRNIAISAAIAGIASWAVQASGGSTSLEKGKDYAVYKPDPKLYGNRPSIQSLCRS